MCCSWFPNCFIINAQQHTLGARDDQSVAAKRDIDSIGKQVRADKRSVHAAELRRIQKELRDEYEESIWQDKP